MTQDTPVRDWLVSEGVEFSTTEWWDGVRYIGTYYTTLQNGMAVVYAECANAQLSLMCAIKLGTFRVPP